MMKSIKRIIVLILCLCVGIGCAVPAFAADGDIVASGNCGENLEWELTEEGILTISGTGAMVSAPWYDIKDQIKSLVFHEGLTSIPARAFYELRNAIGDIVIPDSVESIGSYAFAYYGYGSYTNRKGTLSLGPALKTIGDHAFYRVSLVGDVIIPDSVTNIGEYAFCWYGEMSTQYYSELRGSLKLSNSLDRIEPYTFYNANFEGALEIPDGVTMIGDNAFCNCDFRGPLTLPEGLAEIGSNAFSYNSWMKGDLRIPASVAAIGDHAFNHCIALDGCLAIENPDIQVGECAFHGCGQDVLSFFENYPEYITCVDSVNEYGMPFTSVYCSDCYDGTLLNHNAWMATYMHDPNEINVTVGEVFTVNGASSESYVYSSTDENVVSIMDGEPMAAARGEATVTAVSVEAPHNVYSARVRVMSKQVETYWIENIPFLRPGEQHQIQVHIFPEDADYSISYEVDDENIVSISEDGLITAHEIGTTSFLITISYDDGSFGSGQSISVVTPVSGIELDCADTIRVPIGGSVSVPFQVIPADAYNKTINFTLLESASENGNPVRAYKDGDQITFIAYEPGSAVIRVASADNPNIYRDITVNAVNEISDINLTVPFLSDYEISTLPEYVKDAMVITKNGESVEFSENPLRDDCEYILTVDGEDMRFRRVEAETITINGRSFASPVFSSEDFLYLGFADGKLLLIYDGFEAEDEESFPCTITAVLSSPILMNAGDVIPFSIKIEPEGTVVAGIEFDVGNTGIISADQNGIRTISGGETSLTIRAVSSDGIEFSKTYLILVAGDAQEDLPMEDEKIYDVTVHIPPRIVIGTPVQINIEADSDLPFTVEYKSSDETVLTVDEDGNISAVKEGSAFLTVTIRFSDGPEIMKKVSVEVISETDFEHRTGFRCKRCDWYEENKDHPIALVRCIFWMIHTITHFVQQINALT